MSILSLLHSNLHINYHKLNDAYPAMYRVFFFCFFNSEGGLHLHWKAFMEKALLRK